MHSDCITSNAVFLTGAIPAWRSSCCVNSMNDSIRITEASHKREHNMYNYIHAGCTERYLKAASFDRLDRQT